MSVVGNKGGGCFRAGTLIQTPDGVKPIELIQNGDTVVCFDDAGELRTSTVYDTIKHDLDCVYEVQLWGGTKLYVTGNHWVLNQFNRFVPVSSMTQDDAMVDGNGHLCPVLEASPFCDDAVYNFKVHDYHTYIANGMRVHNGGRGVGALRGFVEGHGGGGGGGKGGGGSVYTPREDPNSLQSKAVARVLDVLAEGEIVGLVAGEQSIFFDDTPVQSADGSYNFSGVQYDVRTGLPDQDYVTGFPDAEADHTVSVEIKSSAPVVRTFTDPDLDAVRIKLRAPQFFSQTTQGDLLATKASFEVQLSQNGGPYSAVKEITIDGKCMSAYEEDHRIELPKGGNPWSIKMVRVTPDSDKATISDKVYWSLYSEIIDAKLIYPDTAYIALTVDSSLFGGTVPKRGYDIKGLKIHVPSNYDPITRVYTGLWDGTFQVAWSDNPAWCLYDLLTNNRYGLGEYIVATQVDKWGLYTIGQYCDELVPDGFGGMEPRFTLNCVLNTRQEAYSVINALVSVFRGMAFWSTGAVYVSQDSPSQPTRLASPANVVGGEFRYEGTALKARHTVAMVSWNDPEDNFKLTVEVVEDPDAIQQWGWRPTDVAAFGCRSRGQAHRAGRWILDSEKNEHEMVYYTAGFDHADCLPGEIVAVADPSYAGVRFGGRIKTAAGVNVVLDSSVPMTAGQTYSLMAVLPDGTVETKASATIPSTTDTLVLTEAFSTDPQAGAMFIVTGSDAVPRMFRVLSKKDNDKHMFDIVALLHDPTKFDRVENNIVIEPTPTSLLPSGVVASVTNITLHETLYKTNNAVKTRLTISWSRAEDPRVTLYRVDLLPPGGSWYTQQITSSNSVDLADAAAGDWGIRVYSMAGTNVTNVKAELLNQTVVGKTAPPPDVTDFMLIDDVLYWTPVEDIDTAGYEIRYQAGTNVSYGDGIPMHDGLVTSSPWALPFKPAGLVTLMIKAKDTIDNYSVNTSFIQAVFTNTELDNVLVNTDHKALGWPGTITNGTVSGGNLVADAASVLWSTDLTNMWTSDTSNMWSGLFKSMAYAFEVLPADDYVMAVDWWDPSTGVVLLFTPDGTQGMWNQPGDYAWNADSALSMWTETAAYKPWPGTVQLSKNQLYKFKLVSSVGLTQGVLDQLQVLLGFNDFNQLVTGASIDVGGSRLPLTKSFRYIKGVTGVTLRSSGTGLVCHRVSADPVLDATLGPAVQIFNGTNTPQAGIIDSCLIVGY